MRFKGGIVLIALGAVRHSGRGPLSRQDQDTLPLHECRLEHPLQLTSIAARCGTLSVPEDREHPQGAAIDLNVAVVPALNRRSTAAPLFLLAGGPGQSAMQVVRGDQPPHSRASTAITPSCCWISAAPGNSSPQSCVYPEDWQAARGSAAGACARRPSTASRSWGRTCASIPPASRCAIWRTCARPWAIEQIDLYGGSYGTRVAELYMRRYPAHVARGDFGRRDLPAAGDRRRNPARRRARLESDRGALPAGARMRRRVSATAGTSWMRCCVKFGPQKVAVTIDDPNSGLPLQIEFNRATAERGACALLSYSSLQASLLAGADPRGRARQAAAAGGPIGDECAADRRSAGERHAVQRDLQRG